MTNLSNTGASGFTKGYMLSAAAVAGGIAEVVSKVATYGDMYRYFMIEKVIVKFHPRVAYTTTGSFTMALDPDPRATLTPTFTDVARHSHMHSGDIKAPGLLVINGRDLHQSISGAGAWLTTNSAADLEWTCGGVIQCRSDNNLADATLIGVIEMEAFVRFKGATAE
jgi:hypothetical protein